MQTEYYEESELILLMTEKNSAERPLLLNLRILNNSKIGVKNTKVQNRKSLKKMIQMAEISKILQKYFN